MTSPSNEDLGASEQPQLGEQPSVSKSIPSARRLRLFRINRIKDGKNISGIGKVIDGVQFENGQVVICWNTRYSSLGVFKSMEDLVQVHAKPFFKENEFEWVDGYAPSDDVEAVCNDIVDFVMRQNVGIKEKAKGNIISKVIAIRSSYRREVDPIVFNKRNGTRVNGLASERPGGGDV